MNIEPGSTKESGEHSRSTLLQHPGRKPRMTKASAGDHRPDSNVDLMAVIPDETAAKDADRILRHLLEGKYEVPVVNVVTIAREGFRRTAPLAQSQARQASGGWEAMREWPSHLSWVCGTDARGET